MRVSLLLAFCLAFLPEIGLSQAGPTVFQDVNVLTMDRERVLEGYSVVIQEGTIQEVAPSRRVQVPAGAQVIGGEGLFLLPGLGDMRVHLPGGNTPRDQIEEMMFLFLANNVTVIRSVGGAPNHLDIKRSISASMISRSVRAQAMNS